MKVTFDNRQSDFKLPLLTLETELIFLAFYLDIASAEAIFHFVSTDEISTLHATFFDDPTPTDCISFPINTEDVLGEVFICPQVALEYALKKKINPLNEVRLYMIHGLLHLIGFDDISLEDRKKMRKMEKECLTFLKSLGKY